MNAVARGSTLSIPHPLTGQLVDYRVPPRLVGSAASLLAADAAGGWCAPPVSPSIDEDTLLAWALPLIAHGALPQRHPCAAGPSPVTPFAAALAAPRRSSWDIARLCTLHGTLLGAGKPSPLRAGTVWLNRSSQGPSGIADAAFVPPPSALLPELLQDLVDFLGDDRVPPAVRIVLGHFQLGCLHPFDDGNGRLARAVLLLQARELGAPPGVALLGLIGVMASKGRLIDAVPAYVRGDAAPVLALARDLAAWVHETLPTVARHLAELDATLQSQRGATESRRRLLQRLRRAPWITATQATHSVGLAPHKCKVLIAALCEEGVLRPAPGEVFACAPVVDAWDALLLEVKARFVDRFP